MNILLALPVILFITAVYSTSVSKIQKRIYRGKPAKLSNFPYQARLKLKQTPTSTLIWGCSGGLISDRHILTAAHCFYPKSLNGEFLTSGLVVLGTVSTDNNTVVRIIDHRDIFIHNKYKLHSYHDIAVILLTPPVTFRDGFIEPIRLPLLNQGSLMGRDVTVAGWGKTSDKNKTNNNTLLYTKLTVVDDAECSTLFTAFKSDVQICVKGNHTSTCMGDSGSPLTVTENDNIKTVVGLVKSGIEYCEDEAPELMTNIHYHLEWIYRTTNLPVRYII